MRRIVTVAVACLSIAVGAPVVWLIMRPPSDVGVDLLGPPPAVRSTADRSPQPMSASPSDPSAPRGNATRPVRITIAALGVDARVRSVGVDRDGSMIIPRLASEVGWYEFGPAPGDSAGNAVIAGHVDARSQGRGAFFRLGAIDVGDQVVVTTGSGDVLSFQVIGRQDYAKVRLPTERVFRREGPPTLVLVTCGGPFNRELSSYRDNIVVIAERS
jgi:LPXTG-site transpeptidase (sortase) family protein